MPSADPHAWLRPFYAALRSHPAFATFALSTHSSKPSASRELSGTCCLGRRTLPSSLRMREVRIPLVNEMCHNVHMKTISIRELHLETGRWVRLAASRGPIVVTDRGRRVAALQPFDPTVTGRPLPNREAPIRKRSKVPVDSAVYQSELREDR
jgi:antitoxin (DNA-binding transcriptional repressor) of toxin-antitoxin stability system